MRSLLLAVLLNLPCAVSAQDQGAALVADTIILTEDGLLVASGNVQAFFEGTTLSASRVTYDQEADRLLIVGEILLRDPNGNVLSAERGDIDPRLEQGVLEGARAVLGRQLQIAAERVERSNGEQTFNEVAATSCQVCPMGVPIWEIRANRVVRDEAAEILTFEDAQFLIRGTPILWLPRLRLPEPGNERETGLLLPRLRASDSLGFGLEFPFFLELGPSRDLTLTPLLAPATLTLEARYRQAFLNGEIEMIGALSRDDLRSGETRGYLAADARFALRDGSELAFSGLVGSEDYAEDYGLAEGEVLESRLGFTRVEGGELLEGGLSVLQDLAQFDDEDVPEAVGDLAWTRRMPFGEGTLTWGAALDVIRRHPSVSERQVAEIGTFASWREQNVLRGGLVVESEARLGVAASLVQDRTDRSEVIVRTSPAASVTLHWPLVRSTRRGVGDILEPLVRLAWIGDLGKAPEPTETSRLEVTWSNLTALQSPTRGEEVQTEGSELALGLAWSRNTSGSSSTFAVGRLLGPEGGAWLLEADIEFSEDMSVDSRMQLAEDGSLDLVEARIDWNNTVANVAAVYALVPMKQPGWGEEVSLDAEFRPSERWTFQAEARYDLVDDRPRQLGLGLGWRNECVEVDLSWAHRYTSADDGDPSTEFGLSVGLLGFSTSGTRRVAPGTCRG